MLRIDADYRWSLTPTSFSSLILVIAFYFFCISFLILEIYSQHKEKFNVLYGVDLIGAATGVLLALPVLSHFGPEQPIIFCSALVLFTGGLILPKKQQNIYMALSFLVFVSLPFTTTGKFLKLEAKIDKRGEQKTREAGRVELVKWDPVSHIEVVGGKSSQEAKEVFIDGGLLRSTIYPFDGELEAFKKDFERRKNEFWTLAVTAPHRLKQNDRPQTLIISAAGGQEIKAALVFKAQHIDAVELIPSLIDLGKGQYSEFNGQIFNHEKVSTFKTDGRVFLKEHPHKKYDLIQIYSAHLSGSGGLIGGSMRRSMLYTKEAFLAYFKHLKPNGYLHIENVFYPKLIKMAADAWAESGRSAFRKHVIVLDDAVDGLFTFIVNNAPWEESELSELTQHFNIGDSAKTGWRG